MLTHKRISEARETREKERDANGRNITHARMYVGEATRVCSRNALFPWKLRVVEKEKVGR